MPVAAAIAPDSTGATLLFVVLAALPLFLFKFRTWTGGNSMVAGPAAAPVIAALCSIGILLASEQSTMKLIVPFLLLSVLGYWGHGEFQELLLHRRARILIGMAIATAFLLVAGSALVACFRISPVPLWLLAIVPTAVVIAHLATAASFVRLWEWPFRVAAVLGYIYAGALMENSGLAFVIAAGFYGLSYSAFELVLAFVEIMRERPTEFDKA